MRASVFGSSGTGSVMTTMATKAMMVMRAEMHMQAKHRAANIHRRWMDVNWRGLIKHHGRGLDINRLVNHHRLGLHDDRLGLHNVLDRLLHDHLLHWRGLHHDGGGLMHHDWRWIHIDWRRDVNRFRLQRAR